MTDEQIWELFAEHTKKGTTAASVLTFARALLAVPGAEQAPIGYVIEMMIERLPNEHQTVLYDRPCGSA
ncbi:hypothetical protein, partial [Caballeronia sp. BR00000012568055]|uniref:hypothetical protein n=1 Tax=Caballeronia sp. BR00000012568055 TaxID=2918761 RepID=UPI0023F96603